MKAPTLTITLSTPNVGTLGLIIIMRFYLGHKASNKSKLLLEPVCLYLRKSREDYGAEIRGEGETLAKVHSVNILKGLTPIEYRNQTLVA